MTRDAIIFFLTVVKNMKFFVMNQQQRGCWVYTIPKTLRLNKWIGPQIPRVLFERNSKILVHRPYPNLAPARFIQSVVVGQAELLLVVLLWLKSKFLGKSFGRCLRSTFQTMSHELVFCTSFFSICLTFNCVLCIRHFVCTKSKIAPDDIFPELNYKLFTFSFNSPVCSSSQLSLIHDFFS